MNAASDVVEPLLPRVGGRYPRVIRNLLVAVTGIILAFAICKGCEYFPESTFHLANDSRLPKWIALPPGLTRADVSITMSYYSLPWGGYAVFTLQDSQGRLLEKAHGKEKCRGPFQLKNPTQGSTAGYPAYEPITVDGRVEMIEHRRMEPTFYITDDASVLKQYDITGCD